MTETYVHPRLGEVVLARTARARRVSISVRPSGAVRVSFPPRVSQRRALAFLDEKAEWVERTRERMAAKQALLPPQLPPEEERARIEALRRAAQADLPARIARISVRTGLVYTKMTVRAMRTKWGSCSSRKTISLTLFLMNLPEELRDFVILHELCHTVHLDHSPAFHALVDRLCGGRERELARALRGYSIRG